jgi:soluble lytic murein transglycosylase-like protein
MKKILTITLIVILNLYSTNKGVEEIIKKYCKEYKVEEALARSIMAVESSSGWDLKPRYEGHLKNKEWYQKYIPEKYKNNKLAYSSIGHFQVLFGTAISMGYTGTPEELSKPENSIKYGIKRIRLLIRNYYQLEKVISFYNAGWNEKKEGRWRNQIYVDNVMRHYKKNNGKIK